ncbi:alpha-amylase [Nocardioides sp. HDW12B]|uniref:alpha-amylase family protein n=1 Tax=Nocardioides sp. HDW12B TaxID=2714939 RepID=UPI0014074E5A|nr:alpha-amylase family protein [Nocardioides sp. HDW12B]QIK67185.1 alpha-amylase [Nocardioides sp. HDW12B]
MPAHVPPVPPVPDALTGLPAHLVELFTARLERWWPDLLAGLAVYPDPEAVARRVVDLAAAGFAARDAELHHLDLRRSLAPDWFQDPAALGYAAYADRFAGDLAGVAERLDHLEGLGVTYLHLMPLLQPRPAPNDGGYAVADYRAVREDLGTTDDLRALATRLRARGMSLCLDLVLNHVATEHEWARRAKAGEAEYRAYFHLFDDRRMPDAYEQTLPEVFPDIAPGSFTWDDEVEAWVWTTFNTYQWDVDWSNPDVFCAYADIVLHLANLGVEVFRLDAIAFLWKRLGTNCQNQPEVHALTQALRTVVRIACPAVVFKAEAIVGPRDLPAYLGAGEHHGKVSDLAYHNGLMVQVWSMLASRDVRLATYALQQLPPTPPTTAWITYARCHDDIGWAIDDGDAAAMGVSGFAHRSFLSDFYSGEFPGSWARGLVFGENEETGDRRISGSLASLAGLECGDPWALNRILLVHALVLGFGGLPVLWMGDEVGLLNDLGWATEEGHADDNRWAHRPRMPWGGDGRPEDPHGLLPRITALVQARRGTPHLHASVPTRVEWPEDPGVLLTVRDHPLGPMVGAYNVTDTGRSVTTAKLRHLGLDGRVLDRLAPHRAPHRLSSVREVELPPYAAMWLTR